MTAPATILIVDDNPTNLKLAADVLEFEGHTIARACDAEEAQQVLKHTQPNLILMDIQMAGMDGLTLTRLLKSNLTYQHIPVVALTAFAMKGDEDGARSGLSQLHHQTDRYPQVPRPDRRNPCDRAKIQSESVNILIVDDQPINQKLLHATLEAEGHTVAEATNGVEALQVLESQHTDVVISDILMPRMDGYRLCSEVRKRKKFEHLPFIHYTATYVSPGDEKLSSDLGADVFLRKPARAEEILGALRRVTSNEHKVRAASLAPESDVMKEYSERLVAKLEHKNLELARAMQELESQRARLGHLLDHSPAVIYALKIEGQKVTPVVVSENIERLLGVTAAEATSYEWWAQSLHPEDRDRVLAVLANSLTAGGYSIEYRIRHKDGSYHWVEDNNRVICDETGQSKESVGAWTDITERKKLQEQFIQSQKMEVLGHLAGGIAHDFNNILSVIFGYAELLMQRLDSNSPLRKYAEEVRYAGDRAAALTRQLLVFSRKEALQPTVVDPNQLIKGLDKMLHRLINENIELTIELGEQIGQIEIDCGYFGQVLMNLVVNARDAMPNGGKLSITAKNSKLNESHALTHPGAFPGDYVMLSVSDTGTGMTDEVKAHMFETFFTTKPCGRTSLRPRLNEGSELPTAQTENAVGAFQQGETHHTPSNPTRCKPRL